MYMDEREYESECVMSVRISTYMYVHFIIIRVPYIAHGHVCGCVISKCHVTVHQQGLGMGLAQLLSLAQDHISGSARTSTCT